MSYLGRVPAAAPIDADDIPDNSITAAKIVDGAIAVADIADDAITSAKIATLTGNLNLGDNVKALFGSASGDLQIYHDGGHSYIKDTGTGSLKLSGSTYVYIQSDTGENMAKFNANGRVELLYDNSKKFETTSTGIDVTGRAKGTLTTDNDGSFDMSASNNFKCTPAGNFTLTFTNIVSQSGFILLVNTGGHTVSAHANSKVDANLLATVTAAGTYLVSYFSDGTNVYLTNSAIYT